MLELTVRSFLKNSVTPEPSPVLRQSWGQKPTVQKQPQLTASLLTSYTRLVWPRTAVDVTLCIHVPGLWEQGDSPGELTG